MTGDERGELPGLTQFSGALVGNRQEAHDMLADAWVLAASRWDRIGEMESFPPPMCAGW